MATLHTDLKLPWVKKYLLFCALGLLIATVLTTGFYYCDEHFQLLEFAALKLGLTTPKALPWEYDARIRPWLQPALYVGIANSAKVLGIDSPFTWAMFYRFFSAILSFAGIVVLYQASRSWLTTDRDRRVALLLQCFLFYVPYLYVRPSSETVSAAFFALGLGTMLLWRHGRGTFLAGICLGLAFESRYQVGIMIFGLALWALFIHRMKLTWVLSGFVGIALVVGAGVLADRWGYGVWIFTPYEYFKVNLVQDTVSKFGVDPWWHYFVLYVTKVLIPHGIIIVLCTILFWIWFPKHVLTWVSAPFFLVHVYIGHKEARFLYPLAPLIPIMLAVEFAYVRDRAWWHSLPKGVLKSVAWILVVVNFLAYVNLGTKSLMREVNVLRKIYEIRPQWSHLYFTYLDPNKLCAELEANFYRSHNIAVEHLATEQDLMTYLGKKGPTLVYRTGTGVVEPLPSNCVRVYGKGIHERIPEKWRHQKWLEPIYRRNRYLELFECR